MFSRSRSPSTSSLDVSMTTDVQFLMFADSYSRKQSEGQCGHVLLFCTTININNINLILGIVK